MILIGPYEHHSNELSWHPSLATTCEIKLDGNGNINLGHLEQLLTNPCYLNRLRISSVYAASNVTGLRTDVQTIASLLHKHKALACFDCAACALYIDIESRGKADTPGVLQMLQAALVFHIKAKIGFECISKREHAYTLRAIESWSTSG